MLITWYERNAKDWYLMEKSKQKREEKKIGFVLYPVWMIFWRFWIDLKKNSKNTEWIRKLNSYFACHWHDEIIRRAHYRIHISTLSINGIFSLRIKSVFKITSFDEVCVRYQWVEVFENQLKSRAVIVFVPLLTTLNPCQTKTQLQQLISII